MGEIDEKLDTILENSTRTAAVFGEILEGLNTLSGSGIVDIATHNHDAEAHKNLFDSLNAAIALKSNTQDTEAAVDAVQAQVEAADNKAEDAASAASVADTKAVEALEAAQAADTKAIAAQNAAGAAQTKADAADTKAGNAATTANAVDAKANEALDIANDAAEKVQAARDTAVAAQTAAEDADTKAVNAASAANAADAKAVAAQTTADAAQSAAKAAQTKADTADTKAANAASAASTADAKAVAADSKAVEAHNAAKAADAKAVAAQSAAGTADTKATNAKTAADAAQSTATAANTAASAAQGTANKAVTKADAAQGTANAAQGTANMAIQKANAAVLKNTVVGASSFDFNPIDDGTSASMGILLSRNGSSAGVITVVEKKTQNSEFKSRFVPYGDNRTAIGWADARWSQVYAASGSISTSDSREKRPIADGIPDAVFRAWGKVRFLSYQMLDAIALKGEDSARIHIGVLAQQIQEAFVAEGVDAFRYGLLCYDSWPEQEAITETYTAVISPALYKELTVEISPEEVSGNGEIIVPAVTEIREVCVEEEVTEERTREVRPAIPSGDRYALRYEECLCLEAAYQRREVQRMQDCLTGLEAQLQELHVKLTLLK